SQHMLHNPRVGPEGPGIGWKWLPRGSRRCLLTPGECDGAYPAAWLVFAVRWSRRGRPSIRQISSSSTSTVRIKVASVLWSVTRPLVIFFSGSPIATCLPGVIRDTVDKKTSCMCDCARTPPRPLEETVITATGLSFSTDSYPGRDTQSMAFFRMPD